MRILFRFFVVACLVVPLKAQITVQRSDFLEIFYVGDTLSVMTLMDSSVNVGQVGGPNTYDFSGLNLVSGGAIPVVLGSQLPKAASRFPNDTVIVTPDEGQAFTFNTGGMFDIGKVKTPNDSTLDYVHRNPPETVFRFPITFGSGFTESIQVTDTEFVNGVFSSTGSSTNGWVGAVDGYGTLKLPGGATYQCLRVTKFENPPCSTCNDDKDINFVTQNGLIVMVNTDHTQPDTGVIRISGFQIIQGNLLTAVETPAAAPTLFALRQNYPNPFNPSTKINFGIPERGFVTLEVFDVLGRKVATLVREELAAGSYERTFDASALPSGVYFDRLLEGNLVETSKMMFVK